MVKKPSLKVEHITAKGSIDMHRITQGSLTTDLVLNERKRTYNLLILIKNLIEIE